MYNQIEDSVKKPANCAKIVKILTYFSGLLVSGFGVVGLVFMIVNNVISSTFFLVFSPIFIMYVLLKARLFGVVIVGAEMQIKMALQSFDFLKTLLGKGLFYIYVSSSVFYFFTCGGYENDALAWVCSMILFGLGLLFTFLHFGTGKFSEDIKGQLMEGSSDS